MNDDENFVKQQRDLIKRGEGCISHMYLDTVGKVTVGVGNMLPNADATIGLPFVRRDSGAAASNDEVRAEFRSVASKEPAKLASSYKKYTKLDLADDSIDDLLDQRIAEFESGLQKDFPLYDTYPDTAKLGLMDMAFNLGNSGLVNKFPSFTKAVREADWTVCAQECQRTGISDERNEEVRKLFSSHA